MNKYSKIAKELELRKQIHEALIGMMVVDSIKATRVIGSSVGPIRAECQYTPELFAKRLAKEIAENL